MDAQLKKQIEEYIQTPSSNDQTLEEAWEAFMKLGPLDQTKIIMHLAKVCAPFCETRFFIRMACRFADLDIKP